MIHDWVFLILWVTSLFVTVWGQHWYDRAKRLADAITYMVEEQAEEADQEVGPEEDVQ